MIRATITLAWGLGLATLATAALVWQAGPGARSVELAHPHRLWLALVPLAAVILAGALRPRVPHLRFSRVRTVGRFGRGVAARLAELPDGLRLAGALMCCLALTQPQSTKITDRVEHKGIDIAIALDLSDSMRAMDLYPNRLEAAKVEIDGFIARRPRDRIALVAFGATASTVSPLTLDHGVLRTLVDGLRLGVMDGTRTAIGAGLGVALNRLEESDAPSKVILLLTDGVHNADGIDPDTVASEAKARGVVIHTVLMGRFEQDDASVDPQGLERIAATTGGRAYLATDSEELRTTLQAILDEMERASISSQTLRAELYAWLLWPALGLLLLDAILRNTWLRRFP